MKKFLISIDTEGDNLWNWEYGKAITTENSLFIPRFQNLCEEYGFKPTYLINLEMALDERFVSFAKKKSEEGLCEIGMHLHSWNTPPLIKLAERVDGIKPGHEFITEHSCEIMQQKIAYLIDVIEKQFGRKPVSHRSGRWATNDDFLRLLAKAGIKYDVSVTPGINWNRANGLTSGSIGPDYSDFPTMPYLVHDTGLLEIPLTVKMNHRYVIDSNRTLKHRAGNLYRAVKGRGYKMLRPNGENIDDMLYLVQQTRKSNDEYLMFMLHSSEMMPAGNPIFNTEEKIEKLYSDLRVLFDYVGNFFEGMTIEQYGKRCADRIRR